MVSDETVAASTAETLRACGLRATMPRQLALEWLEDHPHATAEQVQRGINEQHGTISKQAVYGVLTMCTTAGLVRQIKPAGHPVRFERRALDNHHHVACRQCGRIEDSDCQMQVAPCLHPVDDHGFTIDEAEVVFWGYCQDCQATAAPGRNPT